MPWNKIMHLRIRFTMLPDQNDFGFKNLVDRETNISAKYSFERLANRPKISSSPSWAIGTLSQHRSSWPRPFFLLRKFAIDCDYRWQVGLCFTRWACLWWRVRIWRTHLNRELLGASGVGKSLVCYYIFHTSSFACLKVGLLRYYSFWSRLLLTKMSIASLWRNCLTPPRPLQERSCGHQYDRILPSPSITICRLEEQACRQ